MEESEHLEERDNAPRSLLEKYKLPIGIAAMLIFLLAPLLAVYSTARTLEIEGTIVKVDNDGTIWIRARLDGMDISRDDIEGWGIGLVVKYLKLGGYLRENKFPVLTW